MDRPRTTPTPTVGVASSASLKLSKRVVGSPNTARTSQSASRVMNLTNSMIPLGDDTEQTSTASAFERHSSTIESDGSIMLDEECGLVTEGSGSVLVSASSTSKFSITSSVSTKYLNFGKREPLGKGSFGTVFKAIDMRTNRMIAVKEISLPPGKDSEKQLSLIEREISLLEKMKHPHIVNCLGHSTLTQEHKVMIFMECVSGGTVKSMLKAFGPLHENQASRFTHQLLLGLQYLHSKRVAHRDLKGENLLFEMDGTIKLGDFGAAKELHSTLGNTVAGTATFMAPEVAMGTPYGVAADIWSLGCCVAEMCTGQSPFISLGKNQFSIMAKLAEIEVSPVPTVVTSDCQSFIRRCLQKDPSSRPTCSALLKEKWITDPPSLEDQSAMQNGTFISRQHGGSSDLAAEDPTVDMNSIPSAIPESTYNPVQSYDDGA